MPDAETNLRVLIVEDSADDAALVLRELRKSGYAPASERVETAAAMRAALKDKPWDIILSDYVIPGFGGMEALKIAQESGLDLPFVLVSGKVDEQTLVEAMKAGASDFLIKGHLGRLGSVVKHELADAAARRGMRQAEIEWRMAFDAVRDPMFLHDKDFRIMRANRAYARARGTCRSADIIGKVYWEVFPRGDGPLAGCREALHSCRSIEEEIVLETGEAFLSRATAVENDAGEYLYSIHTMEDITERKRAHAALEESEQRFRSMIENASDLIIMIDAAGMITYASPALERIGGYALREVLGRSIMDFTYPDDLPAAAAALATVLQKPDEPYHAEMRWQAKNGHVVILESVAKNELANPALRAIVINGRDATARLSAERAIRESEARFRAVVEQSIAAVYVIQDWEIVYVNPHMREIFGYAPGEAFEPDPLVHIAESERAHLVEQMSRRLDSELVGTYTLAAVRKDGTAFTMGVNAKQASYLGKPAIIAVAQDITEKQRADDEIKRYVSELESAFMQSVTVATTICEMRDPYTVGHERRVAELSVAIGAELGFDARRLEGLRVAGYLHDVGKITVPAEILSKPTKLTPIEFELIKGHAQASYEVLKPVTFPWPVADIAYQHHERLDGSGYPRGLKGDAILLEARILAVADTVEAMYSHRPYRPGLGIEKALAEIERGRGSAYDPAVADACLRLFREKNYKIPA